MSTNAPMDRLTCKSTTGRHEIAPTSSVHYPYGFGSTRPHPKQRGFPFGVQIAPTGSVAVSSLGGQSIWSSCATTGRDGVGFTGAKSISSSC